MADHIRVPISPGELIDKLTILQLKQERISDPVKLANVQVELQALRDVAMAHLPSSDSLTALWDGLYQVNADLWKIEDDLRDCERVQNFGDRFVQLARAVYVMNDRRADLKKQINLMLGSALIEEKSYAAYGETDD